MWIKEPVIANTNCKFSNFDPLLSIKYLKNPEWVLYEQVLIQKYNVSNKNVQVGWLKSECFCSQFIGSTIVKLSKTAKYEMKQPAISTRLLDFWNIKYKYTIYKNEDSYFICWFRASVLMAVLIVYSTSNIADGQGSTQFCKLLNENSRNFTIAWLITTKWFIFDCFCYIHEQGNSTD